MPVKHDAARNRFETEHDEPGYLAYEMRDDGTLDLQHTIVPAHLEGQGLASQLVKSALEHARANGVRVIPSCSYVRAWLARHDGYDDVLA